MIIADRRRSLNLLNGRALTPTIQGVGVVLISVSVVLTLMIVGAVSFQLGTHFPLEYAGDPLFVAVSWFSWVILVASVAASIDQTTARSINEPTDAIILYAYGIVRQDLIWAQP